MSSEQYSNEESLLREKLQNDPSDWETRRQLAHLLYDNDAFHEAAEILWKADHIPSNDIDLAYAARILAKAQPRRAIRLLAAVLELNRGKAVQNMGMANALLHHGLVLQAARFYGAALEADPSLVNPDLEHFILWTDDEMGLWADFSNRRPKLGELPWMARDPMEALRLTSRVSHHSTPISVPSLPAVPGEDILNELYAQEIRKKGKITPPPAVTIPIGQVKPKDRRYDERYGAAVVGSDASAEEAVVESPKPRVVLPASAVPASPVIAMPVVPAASVASPTSPMPPIVPPSTGPLPRAIPIPDYVVPVVPSVTPTVPITPPAPRSPGSVTGPPVTHAPAPTRRLLTPGGKPTPTAPTANTPPKAG